MKTLLFGIFTAALATVDLQCKAYVEEEFHKGKEREILNGKVSLRKVHNKGFALHKGDKYPQTVRLVSGVVCVLVGIYSLFTWKKSSSFGKKLGASLAFAGAISNTYDRLVRKYVVDYFGFKTKWKKFNRITFNLGDMFIFLGSIILPVSELFRRK